MSLGRCRQLDLAQLGQQACELQPRVDALRHAHVAEANLLQATKTPDTELCLFVCFVQKYPCTHGRDCRRKARHGWWPRVWNIMRMVPVQCTAVARVHGVAPWRGAMPAAP